MKKRSNYLLFKAKLQQTHPKDCQNLLSSMEEGGLAFTDHMEMNFMTALTVELHKYFGPDNKLLTQEVLEEILAGGHLKLRDNGAFYSMLQANFGSAMKIRHSSHHSVKQQYSLTGPVIKEVLIGVSQDEEGNLTTWLQFEKHNTKTLVEFILHMIDYFVYKIRGKNVGPFGLSEHTEQNPLLIGHTADSVNPYSP